MNNKKNNKNNQNSKNNQTRKKFRGNVKKRNSKHIKHAVGGSSYEQKGIAAQLRASTPHNSVLRKKLNEIVHSGDFYESKDRNGFLNLENDFDSQAEEILNEAVDYVKNQKDLNTKIKKRILHGIIPIQTTATTSAATHTNSNTKTYRTPTKMSTSKNAKTRTLFRRRNKTKSRR
jgi:hypothetical protein